MHKNVSVNTNSRIGKCYNNFLTGLCIIPLYYTKQLCIHLHILYLYIQPLSIFAGNLFEKYSEYCYHIHYTLYIISPCNTPNTSHKNKCRKIYPAHSMITKRGCILRSSCFCEKYTDFCAFIIATCIILT